MRKYIYIYIKLIKLIKLESELEPKLYYNLYSLNYKYLIHSSVQLWRSNQIHWVWVSLQRRLVCKPIAVQKSPESIENCFEGTDHRLLWLRSLVFVKCKLENDLSLIPLLCKSGDSRDYECLLRVDWANRVPWYTIPLISIDTANWLSICDRPSARDAPWSDCLSHHRWAITHLCSWLWSERWAEPRALGTVPEKDQSGQLEVRDIMVDSLLQWGISWREWLRARLPLSFWRSRALCLCYRLYF